MIQLSMSAGGIVGCGRGDSTAGWRQADE